MSENIEQRLTELEHKLTTAIKLIEQQIRSSDGQIALLEARLASMEHDVSETDLPLTNLNLGVEQSSAICQDVFGYFAKEIGTLPSRVQQDRTDPGNAGQKIVNFSTAYAQLRRDRSVLRR